jgi:hypothetical protein
MRPGANSEERRGFHAEEGFRPFADALEDAARPIRSEIAGG